jgi:antitoxin component YwqK of YwqJK toxin-antitoxin module
MSGGLSLESQELILECQYCAKKKHRLQEIILIENGTISGTVIGWLESGIKEFETPYKNGLSEGKE